MSKIKKALVLLKQGKLFKELKFRRKKKQIDKKYSCDDKLWLSEYGKLVLGKSFDLENPKTLCEKLNWLKINDRKDIYTTMVDKYAVKEYVANAIGKEYVIPILGVWDSFDEISFDTLPKQFVLKTTHDSGSIVVVKDKDTFDREKAKEKLEKSLKTDYYSTLKEWPYKNVTRRIIAEQYIDSLGKSNSIEYKATCFNGKVAFITICGGIAHAAYELRSNDHYTPDFEKLDWYVNYKPAAIPPEKPKQWDELIQLSEKLSKDVPYLRVDWYVVDGKILFGEMTFYTWGGFMEFNPPEWDRRLGDMLDLSSLKSVENNE